MLKTLEGLAAPNGTHRSGTGARFAARVALLLAIGTAGFALPSTGHAQPAGATSKSGDEASGSATVTEVDTANSTITFSPDNQYLYDNKYNLLPAISSKTYTAATLFCNSGFDKSTVSSVHAGATVQIYLQTAGDASLARVDAL